MSSSTTAPTTAPSTSTAQPAKDANTNPHLLPLHEDDEFEEFPVEDWDTKDTYAASLSKTSVTVAAGGEPTKALDMLWEDNWDDDDVSDDFSVQLRGELLKQQDQMQS
ncbi:hypothetical protein JCM5296_003415 [Sporobolomyces johnsonii]